LIGIDWDGFWSLVENTPGVPSRERILGLKVLSESAALERLRTIGGPQTHRYLLKNIYPKLQYGAVRVVVNKDDRSMYEEGSLLHRTVVIHDTVYVERIVRDTVRIVETTAAPVERERGVSAAAPSQKRFPVFALKTNLLQWAAGAPNIGTEFRLGRRLSLATNATFAHWRIKPHYTLQLAKGGLDLKYWFGGDGRPFTGWYGGVWGILGGRFDVQWNQGWQGDRFLSTGVTGGYSFAVGRKLNIELTASPGLFYTPEMRHYHTGDNVLVWQQTRYNAKRFMFKCAVNLVWLPGETGKNR
jgi:hypothetical protein